MIAAMSMITTSCPRTWRATATGIETDVSSFNQLPDVQSKFQCLVCGDQHVWRPSQAWLAHEPQFWFVNEPLVMDPALQHRQSDFLRRPKVAWRAMLAAWFASRQSMEPGKVSSAYAVQRERTELKDNATNGQCPTAMIGGRT